ALGSTAGRWVRSCVFRPAREQRRDEWGRASIPAPSARPARRSRLPPVSCMSRNTRPFLVVETGRPIPSMRRHGRFPHWVRTAAGLSRDGIEVVDVQSGEALPPPGAYAGMLVTGSGAMVSDRETWSERTADWLRDAAH